MVDASSEGIAITENGIIVDTNDQLGRMLGYDPNEMLGRTALEMAAPDSREKVMEAHRLHIQEPYEHFALHKDGTTFPVEVRGRNVTIGGRELRFTTIRDIRESKRIRMLLEEERNLMRTLIDNLPDLIFIKDAEGRYLLNNRSHILSFGAECQDEVLGKTTYDLNPEELASQYTKDDKSVMQIGKAL